MVFFRPSWPDPRPGWSPRARLDLVDGQPVVIGDLLVDPVRVPAVQNQLLDDLVLSFCKLNRHGTQVPDGRG